MHLCFPLLLHTLAIPRYLNLGHLALYYSFFFVADRSQRSHGIDGDHCGHRLHDRVRW